MDAAPVPPSQNNGNGAGTGVKISEGKNEMSSSLPPTAPQQEQPCGLEVLSSAATGAGGNHVVHVEPHGHGGNLASDYYDVDGMLYSVTTSGENDGNYILPEQYTNFFSTNELYAVAMDPSNGTVTEIGGEDWNHPHHASFIPLGNSDLRQLHSHHAGGEGNNGNGNAAGVNGNPSNNDNSHGARVTEETGPNSLGYSNGSFHQMLRRTYETSQQPSNNVEVMSTASSNSLDSYASQDAPQEVPTHQNSPMQTKLDGQGSQGPVKVRKPRGRKPKHVKEAEAAAAAAAALAAQQQAASQAQHVGTAPGTPIRDGEAYPLRNAQGPMLTMHHRPASQDQQVEGNQQQRPLDQLRDKDRLLYGSRINALPPNFVSRNGSTYQAIHVQRHPNNASGSNNFNLHSHVAAQMTNTAAQVVGANGGGRLDQLFSSRIAAPSNNDKSMDQDKPNIIQANRSIYKLLTAPTTPRAGPGGNFDSKASQERWMQMPNPVAPEDTAAGARGTTPSSAGASGPSGQNRGLPTANQQPGAASVHLVGGFNNRVNIRRDDGRPLPPTTIRIGPGGSTAGHGGMGHHPRSNDYINVRSENYREMYNQLDMFANDNYQLRCGNHYLRKKVKSLMVQLKQAYETIEGLKISVQERSLFAHRDFHAPGHGNASPERSLLDESFGSTSGAMFGDLAHGEEDLAIGLENANRGEEGLWRQNRGRLNLAAAGLGAEGSTSGGGASTMPTGTTRGELKVVKRSLSESESVPAAKKLCTGNNGVESSTGEKSEDKLSQRVSDGTSTVDSNASTLSPELNQKNKEIAEANEGGGSSKENQSPVHSDSTERVSAYDGENSTSTIFNSPIDSRLVTSTTLPIQRTTSLLSAHVTKVIEYHPIRNFSNIASTPKKLDTGVAEAAKDKANGEGYQGAQQAMVQNQNRDGDDQYFLINVPNSSATNNGAGEQADNKKS